MLKGLDIASHQGANFDYAAWPENPDFVIVKTSGGKSYKNREARQQIARARSRGMLIGAYHYQFEPSMGSGTADEEFENFRAANEAAGVGEGDIVVLDVEEYPRNATIPVNLLQHILRFAELTRAVYKTTLIVYTGTYFLRENGLQGSTELAANTRLWLASWQETPPPASVMAPYKAMVLWQYNADDVDKDAFYGTAEDWRRMGINGGVVAAQVPVGVVLPRTDGAMSPIRVTFENPKQPGFGIPVNIGVTVYNPDTGGWYYGEWDSGEYKDWVKL